MNTTVKQMLLAHGMPYQDIMTVLDLSNHAADEMMKMVERISDTAPDHLKMQVTLVAFMAIDARLKDASKIVTKVFCELGIKDD